MTDVRLTWNPPADTSPHRGVELRVRSTCTSCRKQFWTLADSSADGRPLRLRSEALPKLCDTCQHHRERAATPWWRTAWRWLTGARP